MKTLIQLNEAINDRINSDHGPRHAAKNERRKSRDFAKALAKQDDGASQSAAISQAHYAAVRDVVTDIPSSSLQVDFTDWKKSRLKDEFTSDQLLELIRATRQNQGWVAKLNKNQRAHYLRTGFCGSNGESDVDDATDGVYHPFTTDYLNVLDPQLAVDCQEADERFEDRSWTSASEADCDADMSEAATESTGSDTSENSDSDDADSAADATESTGTAEVGAMMQKLIDKRIDERIDNVDDSGCDCDSVSEQRIREIVREEVKDLLGDLV